MIVAYKFEVRLMPPLASERKLIHREIYREHRHWGSSLDHEAPEHAMFTYVADRIREGYAIQRIEYSSQFDLRHWDGTHLYCKIEPVKRTRYQITSTYTAKGKPPTTPCSFDEDDQDYRLHQRLFIIAGDHLRSPAWELEWLRYQDRQIYGFTLNSIETGDRKSYYIEHTPGYLEWTGDDNPEEEIRANA